MLKVNTIVFTLLFAGSAMAQQNVMFAEELPGGRPDAYYYPDDIYDGYDGYDYYNYYDSTPAPATQPPTRPTARPVEPVVTPRCQVGSSQAQLREDRYTLLGSALMIFPGLKVGCLGEISSWDFLSLTSNVSQLYFAVWSKPNPSRPYEYKLVGMNNPTNFVATRNRWNTWTVPAGQRIRVKPGDILGYFYVNWIVNSSEVIIPLATPQNEFDKLLFRTQNISVFAAMMGLPEVVQAHNSIIDFARHGAYLPDYALAPLRANVQEIRDDPAPIDPNTPRTPVKVTTTTPHPHLANPQLRCETLPVPSDEKTLRSITCRNERFLRYFFSKTLKTCVFYFYQACTEIPGKLPYEIRVGNTFDSLDQCLSVCRSMVDPMTEPIEPPTDYGFGY